MLGNGPNEGNSNVPIKVHGLNNDSNGLSNIVKVSAGRSGLHSLAVDCNGYVYAWGYNYYGQCGDGTSGSGSNKQVPVLVLSSGEDPNNTYLGDEAFIIDVDAGVEHSLALDNEGFVYEWGYNNGSSIPQKVPGENGVGLLRNIIDIAACYYSLAVDSNGQVWQWTTGNPKKVTGLEHIVKVAVGTYEGVQSIAIDVNENVWEWTTYNDTPEKVPGGEMGTTYLENIAALDIGYYGHRVAVDEYGYGWGWGENSYGQLGIDNTDYQTEPNQMSCAEIPPLTLTVIDSNNPDCAAPSISFEGFTINSLRTYSICYNANGDSINDVNIVDLLPGYADFNSCTGGGVYDSNTHTVTWSLGNLDANDTSCLTLTVRVAEDVTPGTYLTNTVKLYSGPSLIKTAQEQTKVCCYSGTVLYVDSDANGTGDGLSWQNAYNELRDALAAIKAGVHLCAEQVWVAAGTYRPSNDANNIYATFEMVDDINMYGHFAGNEDSIDERDLADANYATILTGDINGDDYGDVNNVVTAADSRFDGFTVEKCRYYEDDDIAGVFCNSCSPTIENCILTNNSRSGIHCENGANATITNTFINNNRFGISGDGIDNTVSINIDRCTIGPDNNFGIYAIESCIINASESIFSGNSYGLYAIQGCTINTSESIFSGNNPYGIYVSSSDLTVERCSVNNNGSSGIYTSASSYVSAVITDSIIHHNTGYGIYLSGTVSLSCEIRNNTIADNAGYGIYKSGSATPNISSNIIWGNTSGSLSGTFNNVNYNCIKNWSSGGEGNISGDANDPCFINADANDYHLSVNSPCIDAGNPVFVPEAGETDIDGQDRIIDGDINGYATVDMGADEFYYALADILYPDGMVNFLDFAVFAESWRTSQGQPDYNVLCDFYYDGVIDYCDLEIFCSDWLWSADLGGYGMGFGGGAFFAQTSGGSDEECLAASVPEAIDMSVGVMPVVESAVVEPMVAIEPVVEYEPEPVDVEELINWLDELWLSGDIEDTMTEEEYLEFRNSIEQSDGY